MADVLRGSEPQDRLTRICREMTEVFDAHPEHQEGDKCIVFLDGDNRGGLELHGYDDDVEAITNLLIHLKAIFESSGKQFDLMFLDEEGITRA